MLKMIRKQMNKKGFTLIELVVVIAILAILAAIAVPRLIGFQDRAKEQADNQTAAQVKNTCALLFANGEINITDVGTDEDITNDVAVVFTIDSSGTDGALALTYSGDSLVDRLDVAISNTVLLGLIEELITDMNLVSERSIIVTVDPAGAVEAILN